MKKVQVLLSTYNGEKYIKEQIKSIMLQEEVEVYLLIRDDGSTDKTVEILDEIVEKNNNIKLYVGKNIKSARSFMDLLKKSDDEIDYYAFADQDDIWKPKKLISAIEKLEKKSDKPSLYMSALEIVDENLNKIETKKVNGKFTFEGEMIRNFSTGCTMVLNKKMRNIVNAYTPNYIIMHDSWITRVCYAIGGNVIIDDNTYIKYRQHSNNVLGYNYDGSFKKLKKQIKIAYKENIRMREEIAKELKKGYEKMLTEDAKEVINHLINYKENKNSKKWLLKNKKFRSNSVIINIKMKIAILLNKF